MSPNKLTRNSIIFELSSVELLKASICLKVKLSRGYQNSFQIPFGKLWNAQETKETVADATCVITFWRPSVSAFAQTCTKRFRSNVNIHQACKGLCVRNQLKNSGIRLPYHGFSALYRNHTWNNFSGTTCIKRHLLLSTLLLHVSFPCFNGLAHLV